LSNVSGQAETISAKISTSANLQIETNQQEVQVENEQPQDCEHAHLYIPKGLLTVYAEKERSFVALLPLSVATNTLQRPVTCCFA
jgi:hypothetical protein